MELVKEICDNYFKDFQRKGTETEEFAAQINKCDGLREKFSQCLNEEQNQKLIELDTEYFSLSGYGFSDGFGEGAAEGFKLAVRLLMDCMR